MRAFSNWLYSISSGKLAMFSLVFFLAFTAVVLPGQARGASEISGEEGTPDLSFFYTPDDLYGMAEAYGEEGRAEYIRVRFTFDLAWPVVYTFFLATALSWALQRAAMPDSWVRQLNLVPIFGAVFDYLENISTSLVMWRYPQQIPLVDWLASLFTPLKWIFISVGFVTMAVSLVILVGMWVRKLRA